VSEPRIEIVDTLYFPPEGPNMLLSDPVQTISQCDGCLHKLPGLRCRAFGGGSIPGPILDNQVDHREAYPGDHGVRWEPSGPEWAEHPMDTHHPVRIPKP
jgi:hypothetical protein